MSVPATDASHRRAAQTDQSYDEAFVELERVTVTYGAGGGGMDALS
jgi:hypothetical protein